MEYSLKLTVSPTGHQCTYEARVFISARDDENPTSTEQIWEHKILVVDPIRSTDPKKWAWDVLQETTTKLTKHVFDTIPLGVEKTMEDFFGDHEA